MDVLMAFLLPLAAGGLLLAIAYLTRLRYDLDIRSTNVMRCAHCNAPITEANDSGWEVFVTGNMTQPVCKTCDARNDPSGQKLEEDDA